VRKGHVVFTKKVNIGIKCNLILDVKGHPLVYGHWSSQTLFTGGFSPMTTTCLLFFYNKVVIIFFGSAARAARKDLESLIKTESHKTFL
jgi:hypothetical protein